MEQTFKSTTASTHAVSSGGCTLVPVMKVQFVSGLSNFCMEPFIMPIRVCSKASFNPSFINLHPKVDLDERNWAKVTSEFVAVLCYNDTAMKAAIAGTAIAMAWQ
eukprot:scaffold181086_cov15-Tisochrysis_lutea.AAC.1